MYARLLVEGPVTLSSIAVPRFVYSQSILRLVRNTTAAMRAVSYRNGMLLCNTPTLICSQHYYYTTDGQLYAPSSLRGSMSSCRNLTLTIDYSEHNYIIYIISEGTLLTRHIILLLIHIYLQCVYIISSVLCLSLVLSKSILQSS